MTSTQSVLLQTAQQSLQPPQGEEVWSTWYTEGADTFEDFKSYEPAAPENNDNNNNNERSSSRRTLSARQISGQFDDEVVRSFEEDWEDEDAEDTFDTIMGIISRHAASTAASAK
ncbi:hypothetical protein, conserved [Angomonas deanei]|uniref:Uncharacterized protein n=1 Tax=Angomonas deanei TaxID=59799 RepID=A0A7G2CIQ8_9TRYP|nr:hypothetical protein, conserved [Angomonas deanei]